MSFQSPWMAAPSSCTGGELGVGDLDSSRVSGTIQLRLDLRPARVVVLPIRLTITSRPTSWAAAPVLGDVAEQGVLDQIPLAGARREVAHADAQPGLIGQALQFGFPQAEMAPIAAAAVGRDQQLSRGWVQRPSHLIRAVRWCVWMNQRAAGGGHAHTAADGTRPAGPLRIRV